MKQSRLAISLILLLLAFGAGWYILTTPGLKPVVIEPYAPPHIFAQQRVVDLGTVSTDSKAQARFLLYNKGGSHLRISDVETSCGCTVSDLSKKVLAPGDFARLDVTLDTSLKLGAVRKKITVASNDPERRVLDLFLTGEVAPKPMSGHEPIRLKAEDPLVLFKGSCASCHAAQGAGKTGKALFMADCAMCHGQNGQGNGNAGPSVLGGDWENEAHRQAMRRVIAEGSPHSPQMPPFSTAKGGPLNDGQIDSLVGFLKFQAMQNQLGLLKEDTLEAEDEAAFQQALQQPH